MYRLISFFAAIVSAFLLFTLFTQPALERAKANQAEIADYKLANEQADKLIQRVNELSAAQQAILPSDLERLNLMLPNTVDQVGTIMTLDALAGHHKLTFGNITIAPIVDAPQIVVEKKNPLIQKIQTDESSLEPKTITIDTSAETHLRMLSIAFTVTGNYNDFKAYISDLEKNLALMDTTRLEVSEETTDGKPNSYNVNAIVYQFVPGK